MKAGRGGAVELVSKTASITSPTPARGRVYLRNLPRVGVHGAKVDILLAKKRSVSDAVSGADFQGLAGRKVKGFSDGTALI
jgi:hypothetical protein